MSPTLLSITSRRPPFGTLSFDGAPYKHCPEHEQSTHMAGFGIELLLPSLRLPRTRATLERLMNTLRSSPTVLLTASAGQAPTNTAAVVVNSDTSLPKPIVTTQQLPGLPLLDLQPFELIHCSTAAPTSPTSPIRH